MTVQIVEPQTKRWTRADYYELAEQGWFRGQRVQLIEGEIIQMPPQGHEHAKAIMLITRWLHQTCGEFLIRCQMPLNAPGESDPEPDVAVLAESIDELKDHPRTALLVIEVSDSSLTLDRRKASLYAAAGVREYWIVNLEARCIELYRNPHSDPKAEFAFAYAAPIVASENEMISPLAKLEAQVRVRQLID